jgi:hypothetical protein
MTEESKQEAFLDRWSRRKQEQAQEQATPPPAAPAQAGAVPPAAPLPPVESLKPDSDFTPFMASNVMPETRRAALKRLFTGGEFNAPDPFEPYSIDFNLAETMPEEMAKTLNHAKRVLFDDKPKPAETQAQAEAPTESPPSPQPQAQTTELKDVAGKQDA